MMSTRLTLPGGTLKIRATLSAAALLATAAILTACDDGTSKDNGKSANDKPAASNPATTAAVTPNPERSAAEKAAGLPPEPTGADRARLLRALAAVNPDIVRYEGKALDASRNQCMSINGGAQKLGWAASQRFTYKDVTTTEAQGAQINQALKDIGFCKV